MVSHKPVFSVFSVSLNPCFRCFPVKPVIEHVCGNPYLYGQENTNTDTETLRH